MIFEARGQFREAEASFKLGELRRRAAIKPMLSGAENPPSESSLLLAVDFTILGQARMKARQGRFAEAEVDARRALLSQLKNQGKYSPVDAALHRGAGRHPGRAGPLRRRRATGPRVAGDHPAPLASPRILNRTRSSCRSSAAS